MTKPVKNVPLITQLERRECGAACLSMVLAAYDKWIPLERTRIDCGVTRSGVSAGNIVRAARSYGMEAKGYSLKAEALKGKIHFPCIIHWQKNHFVVLCDLRGRSAVINDPQKGKLKITFDEFKDNFTGVVLDIYPGEAFVPSGEKKSIVSFAKKRLTGMTGVVVLITLAMLLNSAFGFIDPVMNRMFLDRILGERDAAFLNTFILILVALAVFRIIVLLLQTLYRMKIMNKMSYEGNASFIRKIFRLPYEFFLQRPASDLLSRKEKNASIAMSLVSTIAPLFLQTGLMIFFLCVMIKESLLLTAVGMVTVVINLFMSRVIAEKRINFNKMMINDTTRLSSATLTGLLMMEGIFASGAEDGFFKKWKEYRDLRYEGKEAFIRADSFLNIIPGFISAASSYTVMFIGVYLTMQGRFTLGLMTAFLGYLSSFMNPAETLISSGQKISEMRTDMDRIEDVTEYPDDPLTAEEGEDKEEITLSGNIEMKNVSFGYDRFEEPLIKEFSLKISAGENLAVIGRSGSGKTTLVRLLAGQYLPISGEVLYDGKSIKDIGHKAFTKNVALIEQDTIFFNDTIRNNIKMWNETVTDEEMEKACKDALIYDEIMSREGGFDAVIKENGNDLSGGQRQRIEIARALLKNPKILILDEATGALDYETEEKILKNLKEKGITCITVTHRKTALTFCDRVIEK